MNRTDILTTAAVLLDKELKYNGREIRRKDNTMTVILMGKPCIDIDKDAGTVTVHGDTPVTRKSCRVINTILRHLTACYAKSSAGVWYLKVPGEKKATEFTGRNITIPIQR